MGKKEESLNQTNVDKGLVSWFLKLSPEERLAANDNAVRAILEMRRSLEHEKDSDNRS